MMAVLLGQVLRATWRSSIQVAIKKNLNPLIQNEDEVALFLELHHPHVVACYGILKETHGGASPPPAGGPPPPPRPPCDAPPRKPDLPQSRAWNCLLPHSVLEGRSKKTRPGSSSNPKNCPQVLRQKKRKPAIWPSEVAGS